MDTAEKAYKLAPTEPAISDTLGSLLVARGDVQRGLQVLRDGARVAPSVAPLRLHLAQALVKSGDRDGARKQIEILLASRRGDFPERDEAERLLSQLPE